MAMSEKVWLPEASLADGAAVEQQREKKKRVKIAKRSAPTVEFPVSRSRQRKQTYSTIESSSYDRRSLYLALSCASRRRVSRRTELRGWDTETVGESAPPSPPPTVRRDRAAERSGLQSRAAGASRAGGRGRKNYEFKHLLDSSAYLTDYCSSHSYSSLVLSRESHSADPATIPEATVAFRKEKKEQTTRREDEEEDSRARCLLKSRGKDGEPCLRQLASRLGVRESIKDGELLYHPRPTPPSFTKKPRVIADILVCTQDDEEDTPRAVAVPQSRPGTSSEATHTTDLPRIPPEKTISSSSVVKYLKINSRAHQLSLGLGEEESEVQVDSHDSLPHTIPEAEEEPEPLAVNRTSERESRKEQQTFLLDDASQREKVLTRKAQALGLTSRDWGKARLVKRMLSMNERGAGDVTWSSRPCTRGYTRPCTRAQSRLGAERDPLPTKRPFTRADTRNKMLDVRQNSDRASYNNTNICLRKPEGDRHTSEQTEPCEKLSAKISEKLGKMRALYEPNYTSTGESRRSQFNSGQRCVGRRPATRGTDMSHGKGEKRKIVSTRPGTRQGKMIKTWAVSDGSQYWNEVPRIGHYIMPQSHSGTKTHIRIDSHGTGPPQRVKIYTSRQRVHEPITPEIELSRHIHRQRHKYS